MTNPFTDGSPLIYRPNLSPDEVEKLQELFMRGGKAKRIETGKGKNHVARPDKKKRRKLTEASRRRNRKTK